MKSIDVVDPDPEANKREEKRKKILQTTKNDLTSNILHIFYQDHVKLNHALFLENFLQYNNVSLMKNNFAVLKRTYIWICYLCIMSFDVRLIFAFIVPTFFGSFTYVSVSKVIYGSFLSFLFFSYFLFLNFYKIISL